METKIAESPILSRSENSKYPRKKNSNAKKQVATHVVVKVIRALLETSEPGLHFKVFNFSYQKVV